MVAGSITEEVAVRPSRRSACGRWPSARPSRCSCPRPAPATSTPSRSRSAATADPGASPPSRWSTSALMAVKNGGGLPRRAPRRARLRGRGRIAAAAGSAPAWEKNIYKAHIHECVLFPIMGASAPRSLRALFSSKKFCKIFQILRHIKSLDACMKY